MEKKYVSDTERKKAARNAVIKEIKEFLDDYEEIKIDIKDLFKYIYKRTVGKILDEYGKGTYDNVDYDNLAYETAHRLILSTVKGQKACEQNYVRLMRIKNNADNNLVFYTQSEKEEIDRLYKEISESLENLRNQRNMCKNFFAAQLEENAPIIDCVFEKDEKNNLIVPEWIKKYTDNISFSTFTISNQNLENTNFEGLNGIRINVDEIANKSLANAKLSGVILTNNSGSQYAIINPSKININGTDFTGSKGAVIVLDNIEKLPDNCNLQDTIIGVNSVDDIKKYKLEKYQGNIFINQKGVTKGEVIEIDFNDYLNYTGTINSNEYKDIKESLIMVCDDKECIRNEMNKIVAYDIASRFIELFNFQRLFNYFLLISIINSDNLRKESIQNNQSKEEIQNNVQEVFAAAYKEVGNVILDPTKIVDADGKVKIYTKNGVLTLDIFKLGVTKEEYERMKKGYYIPEPYRQFLEKGLEKICEYTAEKTSNQKTGDESITAWIDSIDSSQTLSTELTNMIQSGIYNSLERNNLGYQFDLKEIRRKSLKKVQ